MNPIQAIGLIIFVFLAVVFFVLYGDVLVKRIKVKLRIRRVLSSEYIPTSNRQKTYHVAKQGLADLIDALSKLSLPKDGWQNSGIKIKFIRAGLRHPQTGLYFFAAKTLGTIFIPLLFIFIASIFFNRLAFSTLSLMTIMMALFGYYGPEIYVKLITERRLKDMRDHLPDLIDLLVISTESGMGMDSAINRVSKEIIKSSPTLAEEFYLSSLEVRAGSSRMQSLKNLALRVNLEDLNNLVSMLVQADKFGTSLADSLRIQSDLMRVKRMQRAEEFAAKIPVKMLFPLIFFMFPAVMIVLIGPAVIQISNVFGAK